MHLRVPDAALLWRLGAYPGICRIPGFGRITGNFRNYFAGPLDVKTKIVMDLKKKKIVFEVCQPFTASRLPSFSLRLITVPGPHVYAKIFWHAVNFTFIKNAVDDEIVFSTVTIENFFRLYLLISHVLCRRLSVIRTEIHRSIVACYKLIRTHRLLVLKDCLPFELSITYIFTSTRNAITRSLVIQSLCGVCCYSINKTIFSFF